MRKFLEEFIASIVLPLAIIIGGILLARASTAAVEQKSQQTGDRPGIAEAPAAVVPIPQWTTPATCLRVIDGDTIEVTVQRTVRVRLLSCWAPESRTKDSAEKSRGLAAKTNLRQLCEGREVILQVPLSSSGDLSSIWTMGRVLGRVWVDGVEVSERQVSEGFATREKRDGKE